MRKIVVDSSVLVKWVSIDNESHIENADEILRDVQSGEVVLLAPELSKYEIGNALLKKGLPPHQAFQSLSTVYNLPVQFVPETEDLAAQTYEMADEVRSKGSPKFTYYDAAFAALAQQEHADLVTDNPKHQTKIKGITVIPLGEYRTIEDYQSSRQ